MTEARALNSIAVRFLVAKDSPASINNQPAYFCHVQLAPPVQSQPFEPFVSLIQLMAKQQNLSLSTFFENVSQSPKRLREMLLAWFQRSEDSDIEPCNPDEYEYEQTEVRHILYQLLAWVAEQQDEPVRILISHCEFLPVSSSLLISSFRASKDHKLVIDLCATSKDIHGWWPEAQIQRDLKHRFLTASQLVEAPIAAANTLQLHAEDQPLDQQIHWASMLYCGDELLLLLNTPYNDTMTVSLSELSHQAKVLWALTCVNRQDDANRVISDLSQLQSPDHPWPERIEVYQSLFRHYIVSKRYTEAMLVASEYLNAALAENSDVDVDYALVLCFWTECLTGVFRYDVLRVTHLQTTLLQRGWLGLFHLVQSSLWFDQLAFSQRSKTQVVACEDALNYYIADGNQIAISRTYHHLSVIYMRLNRIDEAGHAIELAVQSQQTLPLIERHYNGLNGQSFFLVHAGKFTRALQAVDKAYLLVIEDGNFEQICTTLFNVAYVAFFTHHFNHCIKLIDETFTIMILRGLVRTRFRSNYELKAMQALCNFFRGDADLALAIFDGADVEPQNSLEGHLFVELLSLFGQHKILGPLALETALFQLVKRMEQQEKNALLALLVRKFAHQIQVILAIQWQNELKNNTDAAFACCEQNKMPLCKEWFVSTTKNLESTHLAVHFEKFKAVKLARRELQRDMLKVENSLLKAALNFESYARMSQDAHALLDFFMEGLAKTVRVTYIFLRVHVASEVFFEQKVGVKPKVDSLMHRYPVSGPDVTGQLIVSFDPITEVYQNELLEWIGHMVEQLLVNLERLYDFKKSESLAYIDYLTGLANRAALDRYFKELKHKTIVSLTVGYLDLDNFKLLNDEFGHEIGDRYLKHFTAHLASSIREQDRVFRVGGDEFVVILENISLQDAEQVARRFQQSFLTQLRQVEPMFQANMRLGSSIGLLHVSAAAIPALGKQKILAMADQLMYQAKQSGINCLCAMPHHT